MGLFLLLSFVIVPIIAIYILYKTDKYQLTGGDIFMCFIFGWLVLLAALATLSEKPIIKPKNKISNDAAATTSSQLQTQSSQLPHQSSQLPHQPSYTSDIFDVNNYQQL